MRTAKPEKLVSVQKIYALRDPEKNYIGYVGISNDVAARFRVHMSDAANIYSRKELVRVPIITDKNTWMGYLLLQRRVPEIIILETIFNRSAFYGKERELYWIGKLSVEGQPLTNIINHKGIWRFRPTCPYACEIERFLEDGAVKYEELLQHYGWEVSALSYVNNLSRDFLKAVKHLIPSSITFNMTTHELAQSLFENLSEEEFTCLQHKLEELHAARTR